MKKIVLTLFLILTMCISLCACNADMDSGFQANSSIMQIQGERISESDMSEKTSNSVMNDKRNKNDAETTLKEDILQEKVDGTGDIGSGETYWVSGSSVNFRKSPSTKGEIITQLKHGTEIVKMAEDGEWAYICCGETTVQKPQENTGNNTQQKPEENTQQKPQTSEKPSSGESTQGTNNQTGTTVNTPTTGNTSATGTPGDSNSTEGSKQNNT